MTEFPRRRWAQASVVVLAVLMLMTTGCASLTQKGSGGSGPPTAAKDQGPVPLYYDFGDVLVPSELKIDKGASFVFQTPGLSAGVLAMRGRVEISSLIAFFESNMAKDNWRLVSSFKSPRTIMMFQKENRWCVINITDSNFATDVEIWVAPTIHEPASGLMK
ncbi:MAG: hypothetical protein JEZ11_09565 [Desulfobacterales bacterium]|nr:hypothetical protein [Desulfobacterales bacterium]